jgi:hypothetical protein
MAIISFGARPAIPDAKNPLFHAACKKTLPHNGNQTYCSDECELEIPKRRQARGARMRTEYETGSNCLRSLRVISMLPMVRIPCFCGQLRRQSNRTVAGIRYQSPHLVSPKTEWHRYVTHYADSVTRRHGTHIAEQRETNDFLARDLDNASVRTALLTTRTDVAQVCHG